MLGQNEEAVLTALKTLADQNKTAVTFSEISPLCPTIDENTTRNMLQLLVELKMAKKDESRHPLVLWMITTKGYKRETSEELRAKELERELQEVQSEAAQQRRIEKASETIRRTRNTSAAPLNVDFAQLLREAESEQTRTDALYNEELFKIVRVLREEKEFNWDNVEVWLRRRNIKVSMNKLMSVYKVWERKSASSAAPSTDGVEG